MKRLVVLAGLASVLLGVAACSSNTPGQPSAATTSDGSAPTTDSSSPAPTGSALPAGHPCSLLSSSDLQRLGVSATPTQDTIGVAPSCEMDNADDHIIVSVFTNSGLSGLQASGPLHQIEIGSHQAEQEVDNTGSCVVAIGVTASSSVDVTVTGDGTTDPCPTAMTVAQLVEPKLP